MPERAKLERDAGAIYGATDEEPGCFGQLGGAGDLGYVGELERFHEASAQPRPELERAGSARRGGDDDVVEAPRRRDELDAVAGRDAFFDVAGGVLQQDPVIA